jgi:hypothetical protein
MPNVGKVLDARVISESLMLTHPLLNVTRYMVKQMATESLAIRNAMVCSFYRRKVTVARMGSRRSGHFVGLYAPRAISVQLSAVETLQFIQGAKAT